MQVRRQRPDEPERPANRRHCPERAARVPADRSIVSGMAILPLVFSIQPLIAVLRFSTSASGALSHEHTLLYMLGIPTLVRRSWPRTPWPASGSRARSSPRSRHRSAARSSCWARRSPPSCRRSCSRTPCSPCSRCLSSCSRSRTLPRQCSRGRTLSSGAVHAAPGGLDDLGRAGDLQPGNPCPRCSAGRDAGEPAAGLPDRAHRARRDRTDGAARARAGNPSS